MKVEARKASKTLFKTTQYKDTERKCVAAANKQLLHLDCIRLSYCNCNFDKKLITRNMQQKLFIDVDGMT